VKNSATFAAVVIAASAGAALMLGYERVRELSPFGRTGGEVRSGVGTEVLMMRTNGGLLEVAAFRMNEQFDTKFVYTVLGVEVGETAPHIRVPAYYRYHVRLAPQWKIIRSDEVFTVVTPPIRPTLPGAVDLSRMEKDVGGSWILVPFNREADLNALEQKITAALEEKARSEIYRKIYIEDARKTVSEFVQKWLMKQDSWQQASRPRIEVVFSE
jgi:hypothetical protein